MLAPIGPASLLIISSFLKNRSPFSFFLLVSADLCDDVYKTWNNKKIETKCGTNDGDWGKGCKVNAKTYDDDEMWSCDDWCEKQGLACGAAAYEKTEDSCDSYFFIFATS